jgi:hypothetical protein
MNFETTLASPWQSVTFSALPIFTLSPLGPIFPLARQVVYCCLSLWVIPQILGTHFTLLRLHTIFFFLLFVCFSEFLFFFLLFFFRYCLTYVGQIGLELSILPLNSYLSLLSAGILGLCHHAQLEVDSWSVSWDVCSYFTCLKIFIPWVITRPDSSRWRSLCLEEL